MDLEREMIAKLQVIEDFRNDLAILADRRIGRNSHFDPGAEGGVEKTIG